MSEGLASCSEWSFRTLYHLVKCIFVVYFAVIFGNVQALSNGIYVFSVFLASLIFAWCFIAIYFTWYVIEKKIIYA
jgi:hypothetical protein